MYIDCTVYIYMYRPPECFLSFVGGKLWEGMRSDSCEWTKSTLFAYSSWVQPKKTCCRTFFKWISITLAGMMWMIWMFEQFNDLTKFLENDELAERKPLKIELLLKGTMSLSPTSPSSETEVYTTVLSSLVQPQFSMAMLFGIIGVAILLVGSPFVFAFKQDALKQMTPEVGRKGFAVRVGGLFLWKLFPMFL